MSESQVGTIAVCAHIVGEFVGVAAEINLIVGLVEISRAKNQFAFVVAFKSSARRDVKHAVCAVTVVCRVAAALRFQRVYVLGIDLRAKIACDICVGNWYAINQPADLMAAAYMAVDRASRTNPARSP